MAVGAVALLVDLFTVVLGCGAATTGALGIRGAACDTGAVAGALTV